MEEFKIILKEILADDNNTQNMWWIDENEYYIGESEPIDIKELLSDYVILKEPSKHRYIENDYESECFNDIIVLDKSINKIIQFSINQKWNLGIFAKEFVGVWIEKEDIVDNKIFM
jgi:hypothetical protein